MNVTLNEQKGIIDRQQQNNRRVSSKSEGGNKHPSGSFSEQYECALYEEDECATQKAFSYFHRHMSVSVENIENCKVVNKKKKWYHLPKSLKRHDSTPQSQKIGFGGLKAGTVEPPDPPAKLELTLDHAFMKIPKESQRRDSFDFTQILSSLDQLEKPNIRETIDCSSSPSPTSEDSSRPNLRLYLPMFKQKKRPSSRYETVSAPPSPTSICSNAPSLPPTAPNTRPSSYIEGNQVLSRIVTNDSNKLVIDFRNIKPRSMPLRGRQTDPKAEIKALYEWQNQLISSLKRNTFPSPNLSCPPGKKKSNSEAVRKFIINEFFSTEMTFWNQLNYTKVMHCEPCHLAIQRNSPFIKQTNVDSYANLYDLLQFSSILISNLKQQSSTGDIHIGSVFRELAEYMVVFLRCALDYPANKKLLDRRTTAKGYTLYDEKLQLRRETRVFTLRDYLIIPVQRVARYELLLTDLQKHTEPEHPDAENVRIARYIVHSLASAMDQIQK